MIDDKSNTPPKRSDRKRKTPTKFVDFIVPKGRGYTTHKRIINDRVHITSLKPSPIYNTINVERYTSELKFHITISYDQSCRKPFFALFVTDESITAVNLTLYKCQPVDRTTDPSLCDVIFDFSIDGSVTPLLALSKDNFPLTFQPFIYKTGLSSRHPFIIYVKNLSPTTTFNVSFRFTVIDGKNKITFPQDSC
ncbi:hypothetical protein Ciccas_006943 [Cichlidogyrus casuarinus]|uniref:Uncharacterized protein n=1 Tax=Cichlidogyrus casuarinus TaxID=1844966 RepID=A0ABD2Q4A9_9PLAT